MAKVNVDIQLLNIVEHEFSIKSAPHITPENAKAATSYKIETKFSFDSVKEIASVHFDLHLVSDDASEHTLLRYLASVHYQVKGLIEEEKELQPEDIPAALLDLLIGTGYSSLRGAIHVRSAGSVLQHCVLPMLRPGMLVRNLKPVNKLNDSNT